MKYTMIETKIGTIHGRDAIYVQGVEFLYNERKIKIVGEINGNCSSSEEHNGFLPFYMELIGVFSFGSTELDMYSYSQEDDWYKGSFIEIRDSKVQDKINHPNKDDFKHLILQTYDDVFEIVCYNYKMEIKTPI